MVTLPASARQYTRLPTGQSTRPRGKGTRKPRLMGTEILLIGFLNLCNAHPQWVRNDLRHDLLDGCRRLVLVFDVTDIASLSGRGGPSAPIHGTTAIG